MVSHCLLLLRRMIKSYICQQCVFSFYSTPVDIQCRAGSLPDYVDQSTGFPVVRGNQKPRPIDGIGLRQLLPADVELYRCRCCNDDGSSGVLGLLGYQPTEQHIQQSRRHSVPVHAQLRH